MWIAPCCLNTAKKSRQMYWYGSIKRAINGVCTYSVTIRTAAELKQLLMLLICLLRQEQANQDAAL